MHLAIVIRPLIDRLYDRHFVIRALTLSLQVAKFVFNLANWQFVYMSVTRSTARQTKKLKQKLVKVFEDEGLRITVIANTHSVNFLDVNLDLSNGEFKPYMKPNDTPLYVHSQSNHPKKVLDNIPSAVNDRLSRISSNKSVFDVASPPYQEALRKSGYNHNLQFTPPQDPPVPSKRKPRSRRVTWFNPP